MEENNHPRDLEAVEPVNHRKQRRVVTVIGVGLGLWVLLSIGFGLFMMFFSVWLLEACVGIT